VNIHGEYHESSAEPVTRSVGLSHVSIELGHLYPEDLAAGRTRLRELFEDTVPWEQAARRTVRTMGRRPRISTCFLVDDYFGNIPGPRELVPRILGAAEEAGVTVDYLAREAACARAPGTGISPADMASALLVDEPVPGTLGVRPPARESGWLCNGSRGTPQDPVAAMDPTSVWTPPLQSSARQHSIFLDVQLWNEENDVRTWSCPMLAATWQLLRLGLLRDQGRAPVQAEPPPTPWPTEWRDMPAITRLGPTADPFCAYRTFSILSPRFLFVETAVRTLLEQLCQDPDVVQQIELRAGDEGFPLPAELTDRVGYAFVGRSDSDPP
jgi:hypothetical protein